MGGREDGVDPVLEDLAELVDDEDAPRPARAPGGGTATCRRLADLPEESPAPPLTTVLAKKSPA
ncbi:hypothetical protein EAO75_15940 [Streptomyces sp. uw30]|uniref:hypothetical protein n=1 Tax=Streptomyces sp. uw30 TaxID=1828179 RepID=UPI0011CE6CAB|nr:hypothetical protein [Streptomyces sp. uw30]TXS48442.1 hypothetical protein EAO75_15940 [Streptomyces sp. uw30]